MDEFSQAFSSIFLDARTEAQARRTFMTDANIRKYMTAIEPTDVTCDRYVRVEEILSAVARFPPSMVRYERLCDVVVAGFVQAAKEPEDMEFDNRTWLPTALLLLCQDPYDGDDRPFASHTFRTQLKMCESFSYVINALQPLLHIGGSLFVQKFCENMLPLLRGEKNDNSDAFLISFEDFLSYGQYEVPIFHDTYARALLKCCSAKPSVDDFVNRPLGDGSEATVYMLKNMGRPSLDKVVFMQFIYLLDAICILNPIVREIDDDEDVPLEELIEALSKISDPNFLEPIYAIFFEPAWKYRSLASEGVIPKIDGKHDFLKSYEIQFSAILDYLDEEYGKEDLPALKEVNRHWKNYLSIFHNRMYEGWFRFSDRVQHEFQKEAEWLGRSLNELVGELKAVYDGVPASDESRQVVPITRMDVEEILRKIDANSGVMREDFRAIIDGAADRVIAAKAPKRKRKFGHEGNGRKGPKTAFMENQRQILAAWIKKHQEVLRGKKTKEPAAKLCWLENKNAWDKARFASGDNRGYSSPKALAASFA